MEKSSVRTSSRDHKKKSSVMEWTRFIILILAILIIIPNSIGITKVSGFSMSPTFQDGNIIFEEKISKYFSTPELGDVVIIGSEQGYKIVKRVMAVAGDIIEIKDGIVLVNGQVINEIMTEGISEDMAAVQVPENHIFVMGDNLEPPEKVSTAGILVLVQFLFPILDGYALFSLSPFGSIPKPIELK